MPSTIIRSPYPEVTIPAVSLPALVFADAAKHAAKPAVIDGPSGRALTFRELVGGARLAAGEHRPTARPRRPAVLRWHHRPAQGGHAHPPQPGRQPVPTPARVGRGEDDVVVAVLPFFRSYGQVVLMAAALWQGATLVTMPRFDLEQFLAILQDYRVTVALLVPPIVLALAKHPLVDRFDLSALRSIGSGAAPLDAELAEACARRLDCRVVQAYGLTETSPVLTAHPAEEARIRDGSAGQLVPNTEAKVVDLATGRRWAATRTVSCASAARR